MISMRNLIFLSLFFGFLSGCGDHTEDNDTNVRVIHLNPGDPPPFKTSCWYDYQYQCQGCWYIFPSGEECFICDGPPIGPGPIYPPYGGHGGK